MNWKSIKSSRRKFIGSLAGLGASIALPHESIGQGYGTDPTVQKKQREELEVGKPNGLNIIVIICDTWRWNYLHCSGYNEQIKTPNLDALAQESVYFTNCYGDSFPSIPCRRVIHTGKSHININPKWERLLNDDITFAQILNKTESFTSALIADFPFYFSPTNTTQQTFSFNQGFDSFRWIRGQSHDNYISGPRSSLDFKRHIPEHYMAGNLYKLLYNYMLNTQFRKSQEDYPCAQTCSTAGKWLEDNKDNDGPFMMFVDMFDPHEPWDAPPEYTKMYRKNFNGDRYLIDAGAKQGVYTEEDVSILTAHYCAEVTFSDFCIGRLIDDIKRLGLWDNTIIAFASDHGTHLGEKDCVTKQAKLCNSLITRIPLIIRHPEYSSVKGKRIDALTSHLDFTPTFLSMLGVETNWDFDGQNMWDLVTGDKKELRDHVVTNYGGYACVHTPKWHYFQNIKDEDAGFGPHLYDVEKDRMEEKNVIQNHAEEAADLKKKLMNAHGIYMW